MDPILDFLVLSDVEPDQRWRASVRPDDVIEGRTMSRIAAVVGAGS